MRRQSVFTKVKKSKDTTAVFFVKGEYMLVLLSNPAFDRSIETMQNHCMGVYNRFITERCINQDMDFMEARQ